MMNLTPHAAARHWSAHYIGTPWTPQYTCWGFVRSVQAIEFGRALPEVALGDSAGDRTGVLLPLLRSGQWAQCEGPAIDGDILSMRGPDGPHVGVVAVIGGAEWLVHNLGSAAVPGSVRRDRVDELGRLGYGHLQLWRAAA
jgi:hypothetical protein